ncbi:MAG: alanine--glyoxylate aminotransferase family protein [Haloferacaceae archaeon]
MLMTPGPTALPPSVREAAARELVNPDVDPAFREVYDGVCGKLADVYGTDHDVAVLGGEGILGLEAAVASLVAPGDEVVCLANGLYGAGFADFVESYGGDPVLVESDPDEPFDLDALDDALAGTDPVAATMVHCETPTGAINDLDPVLDRLDEHGVLSVVDAVSSVGGAPVPTDRIDVCLAASQKCLSAPPGLATVAMSEAAWDRVEERDPDSLYTNLLPWRDVGEMFPYTHLSTLVVALDAALDRVLEEGVDAVHERHARAAERCRERGAELGLDLVTGPELASPTVTAFAVPGRATALQERLVERHDVRLATGLGEQSDDVLRVGHMGYNAEVEKVDRAMDALEAEL